MRDWWQKYWKTIVLFACEGGSIAGVACLIALWVAPHPFFSSTQGYVQSVLDLAIFVNLFNVFLILGFVFFDLLFRLVIFGDFHSIGTDVVLFCLAYRLSILTFIFDSLAKKGQFDILVGHLCVITILFILFIIEIQVFRHYFRGKYETMLRNWLRPSLTNIPESSMIEDLCAKYRKARLWGVGREEEIENIRAVVRALGKDPEKLQQDPELPLLHRILTVIFLAIPSTLALIISAVSFKLPSS